MVWLQVYAVMAHLYRVLCPDAPGAAAEGAD